jgi:prefoldin subunit 5
MERDRIEGELDRVTSDKEEVEQEIDDLDPEDMEGEDGVQLRAELDDYAQQIDDLTNELASVEEEIDSLNEDGSNDYEYEERDDWED